MSRQCMRTGCDRPVAACLTYDPVAASVWLDPPVTNGAPVQHVCWEHASALTAPRGWTIIDRRRPTPAPESSLANDVVLDVDAPESDEPTDQVEQPPAEDDEAVDRAPARPKGKLLDRAFAWTGPQHSVLTTQDRDPDDPARRVPD